MTKISLPFNSPLLTKDFVYGVATASFQIEGGYEHRLPCIWDTFCSTAGKIADNSHGHIACDHYNNWQQDIDLIESLGVDAYRLSISWPRVMTQDGKLNPVGVKFYTDILDELKRKNIKAFVTLYHWDLPQHLEDEGGWLNRKTAYAFEQYVELITNAFGTRVYSYATLNEPFCSAFLGYEIGIHAPGLVGKQYGKKAAHHLLLAHGLAMNVLNKTSPDTQNGIVLNFTPAYPLTDTQQDIDSAKYADDYLNQWYMKPIMDGKYPDIINQLPEDHLPEIHPGDMELISQPIDYLGINFYTRQVYKAHPTDIYEPIAPTGPLTDMGWEVYPQSFTDLLVSLNKTYTLPPIYITENGAAMPDTYNNGAVNDLDRLSYYNTHLNAVHNAIEQGVVIHGYFAWSLMDNFEWAEGYLKRFGIVYVDYKTQQRTIKKSGLAYKELISKR
ncbi:MULTISPECIES: GH1 family beta-glucosidase [unclassified Pseudoalteromonas]|uniref:GH1 family beta-glucosidase n=1 Tax=unclassified Pseudoalteromonas TaxID=194690 RepID=UPI0015FAAB93|nr:MULTISPECIES: GH1 family beta-glucosidase [unclassified Pseudoalteromonas]MBB1307481.1 beta-glucosidase [Pseudoalteromonas sp. SR43-5]MBB1349883.1 beta-glucosidase [Pseudoalteromonas sp. SG45-3]MBB1357960.1 beta-glucosidase [Pseudoalteromonas sp. SG45-6]MBB1403745.1 beta-glucosidase [Pseudoalteromonas sp. SG45-1]MBB1443506.1 beta-glucosidase [Pseudoalteromonas sp. SG43-3]